VTGITKDTLKIEYILPINLTFRYITKY